MFSRTYIGERVFRKISASLIAGLLCVQLILPPPHVLAQGLLQLPVPGTLVGITSSYNPAIIRGMTIHPENPFEFDFMIDPGESGLKDAKLNEEATRLMKYFLASLTVPEDQMWVNLSPYEKNRIIPETFRQTEMGRDLLAQDYLLKQLSASLMYPEDELGQRFWKRVRSRAKKEFGSSEIPMNTFNKIWIVPSKAKVYIHENNVFVAQSHLQVMLEEDYLALEQNSLKDSKVEAREAIISGVQSEIVREILIPEIEREVNEGELFANLRQIYHSMILATWYKQNLKSTLLSKVYVDQHKVKGVENNDPEEHQKIYDQYVEAFKKGVYNYIREDLDEETQELIPRQYFAGGVAFDQAQVSEIQTANAIPQEGLYHFQTRLDVLTPDGQVDLAMSAVMEAEYYPPASAMTADYSIAIRTDDIDLSQKVQRKIRLAIHSRDTLKGVQEVGRSLIFPLAPEEYIEINGRVIKGLRLKGVTHRGYPPVMEPYDDSKNENERVRQPNKILVIQERQGGVQKILFHAAPATPTGALELKDAFKEYEALQEVQKIPSQTVDTDFPLGVGEFTGLQFEGQPTGFVILGLEQLYPHKRLGSSLEARMNKRPESFEFYNDIMRGRYKDFVGNIKKSAITIARLHKNGIMHNYLHLDQFSTYDTDAVKVFDFEDAKFARDISEDEFVFRAMRDFFRMYISIMQTDPYLTQGRKLPTQHFMGEYFSGLSSTISERMRYWFFSKKKQREFLSLGENFSSLEIMVASDSLAAFLQDLGLKSEMAAKYMLHLRRIYQELKGTKSSDLAMKTSSLLEWTHTVALNPAAWQESYLEQNVYMSNDLAMTSSSDIDKEPTWDEVLGDGYTLDEMQISNDGDVFWYATKVFGPDGKPTDALSNITFDVYPALELIIGRKFYPYFPYGDSSDSKPGRGRALFRHIFGSGDFAGYDRISYSSPKSRRSFLKMSDLWTDSDNPQIVPLTRESLLNSDDNRLLAVEGLVDEFQGFIDGIRSKPAYKALRGDQQAELEKEFARTNVRLKMPDAAMKANAQDEIFESDLTWDDVMSEGYRLRTTREHIHDGWSDYSFEVIGPDGKSLAFSQIGFNVYPELKLIVLKQYYPNFPRKESSDFISGRGRALFRELFQSTEYGGYHLISLASHKAHESFLKMSEYHINPQNPDIVPLQKMDSLDESLLTSEGLANSFRSYIDQITQSSNFWSLNVEERDFLQRSFGVATVHLKIPAGNMTLVDSAMKSGVPDKDFLDPAAVVPLDPTWDDVMSDGYLLRRVKPFGFDNFESRRYEVVGPDGNVLSNGESRIMFDVYPDLQLIVLEQFYPGFPSRESKNSKPGRGRALFRHLFDSGDYDGYDIISFANSRARTSFLKMSEFHPNPIQPQMVPIAEEIDIEREDLRLYSMPGLSEPFLEFMNDVRSSAGYQKLGPGRQGNVEQALRLATVRLKVPQKDSADRKNLDRGGASNDNREGATKGGIDLNPSNLTLEIEGKNIPVLGPQMPLNIDINTIQGMVPVIINVTPITNMPFLLGLIDRPDSEESQNIELMMRDPFVLTRNR